MINLSRSADYTIQGFLYQFHKSLLEIFSRSSDEIVFIEGIVEDVEVKYAEKTEAIQCKYHETVKNFTLSQVYKPILQMMEHFYTSGNEYKGVTYILYAYFPDMVGKELNLTEEAIHEVLSTKNENLRKKVEILSGNIDIKAFLEHFHFEFGESMEKMKEKIFNQLSELNFKEEYIDNLIYPNAINIVAKTSTLHSSEKRAIKIGDFLESLRKIKNTALTKWTLSLKNYKNILETRRKQLRNYFHENSRLRYFLIKDEFVEDFDNNIVNFIKEYLEKYHFKLIHYLTPVFCLDCTDEKFNNILFRLNQKNIKVNHGYISPSNFDDASFFRKPIVEYSKGRIINRDFDIRILHISKHEVLNKYKADDLILIADEEYSIDHTDVNIEKIELSDINAIKFVMGMRETYE